MILLIYAVLNCWFVFFTYTEVVGDSLLDDAIPTTLLFTMILMYMLALTLAVIVSAFTIFHFWLITNGKTTLEHCEKAGSKQYGESVWENFTDVFGENILVWPFPCFPNLKDQGTKFKLAKIE